MAAKRSMEEGNERGTALADGVVLYGPDEDGDVYISIRGRRGGHRAVVLGADAATAMLRRWLDAVKAMGRRAPARRR